MASPIFLPIYSFPDVSANTLFISCCVALAPPKACFNCRVVTPCLSDTGNFFSFVVCLVISFCTASLVPSYPCLFRYSVICFKDPDILVLPVFPKPETRFSIETVEALSIIASGPFSAKAVISLSVAFVNLTKAFVSLAISAIFKISVPPRRVYAPFFPSTTWNPPACSV